MVLILLYFSIQENHSLLQKFQHRYGNVNTKLQQLNYIIYTKLTATSPTTATTINYTNCTKLNFPKFYTKLHLNLSTMATLGTEESGHHKEVVVVEKFTPALMYALFASGDIVPQKWQDINMIILVCTLVILDLRPNFLMNNIYYKIIALLIFLYFYFSATEKTIAWDSSSYSY